MTGRIRQFGLSGCRSCSPHPLSSVQKDHVKLAAHSKPSPRAHPNPEIYWIAINNRAFKTFSGSSILSPNNRTPSKTLIFHSTFFLDKQNNGGVAFFRCDCPAFLFQGGFLNQALGRFHPQKHFPQLGGTTSEFQGSGTGEASTLRSIFLNRM